MNTPGPRRHRSPEARFKPLQFGGWRDYQEWVDHDFLPCPGFCGDVLAGNDGESIDAVEEGATDEIALSAAGVAVDTDARPRDDSSEAATADLPDPDVPVAEARFIVRPYVRTMGRAEAAYDLRLETMLVTPVPWGQVRPSARPPRDSDMGRICLLCDAPLSVAELSAYLGAPLGVVRVLAGDAIGQGLIVIQSYDAMDGNVRPSMQMLRRVHEGLLRLA